MDRERDEQPADLPAKTEWGETGQRAYGRVELSWLLALTVILGGIWLFMMLGSLILDEEEPHALDVALLLALREPDDLSDPIGPHWLEEAVRDFTAFGGGGALFFITLAVMGYMILHGNHRMAWLVLFTIAGGFLLTFLLKMGYDRPRPDLVPHIARATAASFPSGHSSLAAILYLTLGALLARLQTRRRLKIYVTAVALLLTLLVGFSRVYLGVHWPSDVLGGWIIGAVWAMLVLLLYQWWRRRGPRLPKGNAG